MAVHDACAEAHDGEFYDPTAFLNALKDGLPPSHPVYQKIDALEQYPDDDVDLCQYCEEILGSEWGPIVSEVVAHFEPDSDDESESDSEPEPEPDRPPPARPPRDDDESGSGSESESDAFAMPEIVRPLPEGRERTAGPGVAEAMFRPIRPAKGCKRRANSVDEPSRKKPRMDEMLLAPEGPDPTAGRILDDWGNTFLHYIAGLGHFERLRYLVENGADFFSQKNRHGQTPYDVAAALADKSRRCRLTSAMTIPYGIVDGRDGAGCAGQHAECEKLLAAHRG